MSSAPVTDAKRATDLTGKVAIVTGSGKENGIGAGIAEALASAGARVTINYVSEATGKRAPNVVAKIEAENGRGAAIAVQADVGTQEGVDKLVKATLEGFGVDHIDIVVNNAVWTKFGSAFDWSEEEFQKTWATGVVGPFLLLKAALPHVPRGGRIINIGSITSKLGVPDLPVYSATKAAMDTLSWSISGEIGRQRGITINTIAPGPVLTDAIPAGSVGDLKAFLPMTRVEERFGTPKDIGDAVLLLASERSRWITGQYISASGGIVGP